jgi:hypothetical protein
VAGLIATFSSAQTYTGNNSVKSVIQQAGNAEGQNLLEADELTVENRRARISFELPPRMLCVLSIRRR